MIYAWHRRCIEAKPVEWIVLGFLLIHLALLLGVIAALILTLVSRGGRGNGASGREEESSIHEVTAC